MRTIHEQKLYENSFKVMIGRSLATLVEEFESSGKSKKLKISNQHRTLLRAISIRTKTRGLYDGEGKLHLFLMSYD